MTPEKEWQAAAGNCNFSRHGSQVPDPAANGNEFADPEYVQSI
jgi:hypothetical protein